MAPLPPQPVKALGAVLVTGGCGMVGSHIVEQLKDRFPSPATSVTVVDLRTSLNNFEGVEYISADLSSAEAIEDVFAKVKPNVVIHTASPHISVPKDVLYKVNVDGTRNLLNASKKFGVKAFVYTSSASVVSDQHTDLVNADERYLVVTGKLQLEYYADTKAQAEALVLEANVRPSANTSSSSEARPLLTVALRPSGIFGERDNQAIPGMINALHDKRTAYQLGENNNLFDWTYVGNVAHAHLLAAQRLLEAHTALSSQPASVVTTKTTNSDEVDADDDDDRVDGEPFFITNAEPVYFWDFARAVWAAYYDATGQRAPVPATNAQRRVLSRGFALALATTASWACWILRMNPPSLDPTRVRFSCMTRYFSTAKAQALLGYPPRWTLEEAIVRSTAWFAAQRFPAVAREAKKTR